MNTLLLVILFTRITFVELATPLRRFYMEGRCGMTIDMDNKDIPAGRLSVTNRVKYRQSLSCHVTIVAPPFMQLTFVFREMDIEYEAKCDDDYVTLYDGPNVTSPIIQGTRQRMCGHKIPTMDYVTSGTELTIHFHSDVVKQENGFEIVFTAFHTNTKCLEDEFRCDNGRCISSSLRCNNFNNCGDGSDRCKLDTSVVVALVISIFLLTVIGTGTITLYRNRKKQQRTKKKQDLTELATPRYPNLSMASMTEIQIQPCDRCAAKIIEEQLKKFGLKSTHEHDPHCDWIESSGTNSGFYLEDNFYEDQEVDIVKDEEETRHMSKDLHNDTCQVASPVEKVHSEFVHAPQTQPCPVHSDP